MVSLKVHFSIIQDRDRSIVLKKSLKRRIEKLNFSEDVQNTYN